MTQPPPRTAMKNPGESVGSRVFLPETARNVAQKAPTTPVSQTGTAYDRVVLNTAAQRLAYWDSFDGRTGVTGGGSSTSYERYVASGPCAWVNDGTTGRTAFETQTGTGGGAISYLALRGDTTSISGGFKLRSAENWWLKFLAVQQTAPVGGTQEYILGVIDALPAGTQVNGLYLRSVDAGNWFLVCRNAGAETTLDLGVGVAAMALLELRCELDGGRVAGYANGLRIGTITTNIPAALQTGPFVMHHNRVAPTTAGRVRCYGWGWTGDLIA